MAGTKEGGITARETLIRQLGSEEAMREHFRNIGRIGGRKSNNGGFASDLVGDDGLTGKQRALIAGAKGGRISRRGSKVAQLAIEKAGEIK